jgi:hypothetical protein
LGEVVAASHAGGILQQQLGFSLAEFCSGQAMGASATAYVRFWHFADKRSAGNDVS